MAADPPGAILSGDTSPEAERVQIDTWRGMTTVQRARLIADASRAIRVLALAGLRTRHPAAGERELIARLAEITLGKLLAARVYPELERRTGSRSE